MDLIDSQGTSEVENIDDYFLKNLGNIAEKDITLNMSTNEFDSEAVTEQNFMLNLDTNCKRQSSVDISNEKVKKMIKENKDSDNSENSNNSENNSETEDSDNE